MKIRAIHEASRQSDRGSQYTSDDFQHLLKLPGVIAVMSSAENCWGNGVPRIIYREK